MCEVGRCWMPLVPAPTGLPGPAAVSSASSSQPGWSPWLLRYQTPRVPRPARYHELDRRRHRPCPLRRSAVRAQHATQQSCSPGVSAAVDRAANRPPRDSARSLPATAVMSGRPVSLTWCLRSLAGAVCAGCRCLPGRGCAAGRLAPALVVASMTTRLCRGHRTAWHS